MSISPSLRRLNRHLRDKRFLVFVCSIRRRCLGSLRRWGDHQGDQAHQQHLGHAIMPPIVRLAKPASTRTSLMRPSGCRRYNLSRAEDRRGGFVLHDNAARRTGDPRAARLWSRRRTGYNRRLGHSGCDFVLITQGEQHRTSSRWELTGDDGAYEKGVDCGDLE